MFKNLRELIASMPDEKQCRDYLAAQRWPDGKVICPYCGCSKVYKIEERDRWKCSNKECAKKFSVTVGTFFQDSKIPICKWLTAVYLSTAHKKGISSYQLGKDIGVSQKCAWFMLHRIRGVMSDKTEIKLNNVVEIDETWCGGKIGNMHKERRIKFRTEIGGTIQNKSMVMGLIERGGHLKLFPLGKDGGRNVLQPVIRRNVDASSFLITDSSSNYEGLDKDFSKHEIVNHANEEYVRDGNIYTNTIEGVFSQLKRSIYGIYHQCSEKHLSRYCDETMFRYNFRKMKDADRFNFALKRIDGRLTYKELIQKEEQPTDIPYESIGEPYQRGKPRKVVQIKDGELIAVYDSIRKAAEAVKSNRTSIWKALKGTQKTGAGYEWKYL